MFFVLVSVILAISEQDVFTSLFVRSQHVYIECYHQEYFSDKASSFFSVSSIGLMTHPIKTLHELHNRRTELSPSQSVQWEK